MTKTKGPEKLGTAEKVVGYGIFGASMLAMMLIGEAFRDPPASDWLRILWIVCFIVCVFFGVSTANYDRWHQPTPKRTGRIKK